MARAVDYKPLDITPGAWDFMEAQADLNGDSISVVIDLPNVVEAANDTWSYVIPFRLVGSVSGKVIPYSGTIGAAITNTTGSGHSPTVSSATPTVVMGHGVVTAAHGGTGYTAADKQTVTLTATLIRGSGTVTDTWTHTCS